MKLNNDAKLGPQTKGIHIKNQIVGEYLIISKYLK